MKKVLWIFFVSIFFICILLFVFRIEVLYYLKNYNTQKVERNLNSDKDLKWGIDISHYQRDINWNELLLKNKPDFIVLKATEGAYYRDSKYDYYKKMARSIGVKIGAYHFFNLRVNGKKQAYNFIKTAKLCKGDLYPVLDIEFKDEETFIYSILGINISDKSFINNIPKSELLQNEIESYCNVIFDKYKVQPIIYCEYFFYNKYLKYKFKNYKYWISNYYGEPCIDWDIWQYTDNSTIKGINGVVDRNIINKKLDLRSITLD